MPKAAETLLAFTGRARNARASGYRKDPLRTFTLFVGLPAAAIFCGVCTLILMALYLMSAEINSIDADRGRKAIAAAIESVVVQLGESAVDEATWTEAYINTYVEPNPAWLDSTWGATARISETYDTALVTDVEGRIAFGESSRGPVGGLLQDHYGGAEAMLAQLDARVAEVGDDARISHLARNRSGVVAIAAAVIHGNTGQASVPREVRRVLWLVRQLDDAMLRATAARFQLPLPRLVERVADGQDSMILTNVGGDPIATIAWQPRRPGDPAFAHTAGIAAVVMLVIGALTFAVLAAFRQSIMSRAEADERDWYNARYDPVTGLVNGFGLEESLRRLVPRRSGELGVAIAQIGVDGFAEITSSYGREAGDRLLDALADRIDASIGGQAAFARTAPDQFALARAGDDADLLIEDFAERVLGLVSDVIDVGDLKLKVGLSIGLAGAVCTKGGIANLARMAEAALARARETGGNHIVVYDPAFEDERRRRLALQADIRRGLEAGEFDLDYQPIIDFTSRTVIGVEALMRWPRRPGGAMSPSEFIPAAESSGLIEELGMFALRRAAADIGPLDGIKLSVNVSTAQLRNPHLAEDIGDLLLESGVDSGRLQLEVTESFLVAHPDRAKQVIDALRARGIVIALDDFGTGYSSIGYLRQFRFDRVKLDRSLVAEIDRDPVQSALVESTMIYAFAMGLAVTAEGVERREEAALLSRLGCREFQGFLFSRPLGIAALTRLVGEQEALRQAG